MKQNKRAVEAVIPTSERELSEDTMALQEAKERADRLGCIMQMFVAYNPDSETFVFASNDPNAREGKPSEEALLLSALVVEYLAELANPAKPGTQVH